VDVGRHETKGDGERRRLRGWRFALLSLVLVSATGARAEPVAYAFTAVVSESQAPGAFPEGFPAIGEIVRGSFRYQSDRTGRISSDSVSYRLFQPANGFYLELPSRLDFLTAPITIGLTSDYKGEPLRGAHLLRIGSEMRGKEMGWPFDVARVRADIVLWDEAGVVASELVLPTSLDLTRFTRAELAVIGSWGPQDLEKDGPLWSIRGRIDSLTPIPISEAIPAESVSTPSEPSPADPPSNTSTPPATTDSP
jgi:hypothetical protein